MFRRLGVVAAAFRRQSRGNVAVTFGLAVISVIMAVGAAVDYSLANRAKAVLDGISDATALSAVGQAALAIPVSTEQKDAVSFFKAQAASLELGSLTSVEAKVKDSSSGRTAVVTYTASVPTAFMAVIGINSITVSAHRPRPPPSRPISISICCSTIRRRWVSARRRRM